MDGGGPRFTEGEGAGTDGGAGGVDIVDEDNVFSVKCLCVCLEVSGGEAQAGSAGFLCLRRIGDDPFECGNVAGMACEFG